MANFNEIYNNLTTTKEDILSCTNEIEKIRDCFEEVHLDDTAIFFTDKLIELKSRDKPNHQEVYRMAKYYYRKEHYYRGALLIINNNLHLNDLSARYLAAKCYFECKDYAKSLEILSLSINNTETFDVSGGSLDQWKSSIELLKGYIYEALSDKDLANRCFINALELDIFCYEAFQSLIKFDMINNNQENELLEMLSKKTSTANKDKEVNLMVQFYKLEFSKAKNDMADKDQMELDVTKSESALNQFNNSAYLRLIEAEQFYEDCHFEKCYEIILNVYTEDNLNLKCIFLMIGCLLELQNKIDLQNISHKLIEAIPESALTWYSVGCYYFLTSNMDYARKYFSKSSTLDPNFQASLLMYGHTFEEETLHSQAIAVYLDLCQKMTHSYLPLFYVGIEYSHLNNPIMAEEYLNQALEFSPNNLFVLHELGIVYYQKKNFENAKEYFLMIYNILIEKQFFEKMSKKWEPLLNNLGHVYRKLGDYNEAIHYFNEALYLVPNNSSTLDSIGLVYSLMGEPQMACDYFEKSLSLKRDDAFASTMYNMVFQDLKKF